MTQCEICREIGEDNCKDCYLGNPCLGCDDYYYEKDICMSNGACFEQKEIHSESEVLT